MKIVKCFIIPEAINSLKEKGIFFWGGADFDTQSLIFA